MLRGAIWTGPSGYTRAIRIDTQMGIVARGKPPCLAPSGVEICEPRDFLRQSHSGESDGAAVWGTGVAGDLRNCDFTQKADRLLNVLYAEGDWIGPFWFENAAP